MTVAWRGQRARSGEHDRDHDATARRLMVSVRSLKMRLRQLGVATHRALMSGIPRRTANDTDIRHEVDRHPWKTAENNKGAP